MQPMGVFALLDLRIGYFRMHSIVAKFPKNRALYKVSTHRFKFFARAPNRGGTVVKLDYGGKVNPTFLCVFFLQSSRLGYTSFML